MANYNEGMSFLPYPPPPEPGWYDDDATVMSSLVEPAMAAAAANIAANIRITGIPSIPSIGKCAGIRGIVCGEHTAGGTGCRSAGTVRRRTGQ